jgi:oligopeptide/dipeptide ABC transporter ATP-binding protein
MRLRWLPPACRSDSQQLQCGVTLPETVTLSLTRKLLDVQGLSIAFATDRGQSTVVRDLDLHVSEGETLAIVGESGSGKSVTALSITRLIDHTGGHIAAGRIMFADRTGRTRDIATENAEAMRALRGPEMAMIFQEPMSSLNPLLTVGEQISEVVRLHQGLGRTAARQRAIEMLGRVNIPDPERRAREYPHRLSGGMRQRVMIAMALACRPALLIADEPTTALDVTIQAQILHLIRALQIEMSMSVLFITHNLGVVAQVADRVAVMYAGRIVEQGDVRTVFAAPLHPYTRALLRSIPRVEAVGRDPSRRLLSIPGQVPSPVALPPGCSYAPRCPLADDVCRTAMPPLAEVIAEHDVRCHHWDAPA